MQTLKQFNVEIISTGGTYQFIKDKGYDCTEISNYTGFPEIMDGRVKTLHPKIHGGLLGDIDKKNHAAAMEKIISRRLIYSWLIYIRLKRRCWIQNQAMKFL